MPAVAALLVAALVPVACDWPTPAVAGCPAMADAFAERRSDVWVECSGEAVRLLADDNRGSRHQRFVLALADGQTVLISHNIDLAPRVEGLRQGDRVRFRGEYEYNDRGGVVHWTHHDPGGRREGGWLEHEGRRYE